MIISNHAKKRKRKEIYVNCALRNLFESTRWHCGSSAARGRAGGSAAVVVVVVVVAIGGTGGIAALVLDNVAGADAGAVGRQLPRLLLQLFVVGGQSAAQLSAQVAALEARVHAVHVRFAFVAVLVEFGFAVVVLAHVVLLGFGDRIGTVGRLPYVTAVCNVEQQ